MDIDEGKAVAKEKRLKGRGWRLAELDYFRHPHEALSAFVFAILTLFAIWLIYVFASAMWTLIAGLGDPKAASENAKNLLLTVGASVAAPFVVWRTWIAHQQWQVGVNQSKTQIETMQTGLLTKAIKQLGAMREEKTAFRADDGKWETRTETVPNIEVRLGAIYLLKRLAEDNDRDHGPILETLCAYVRENSRQEWKKWSREEAKRRGQATTSNEEMDVLDPVSDEVKSALALRLNNSALDSWKNSLPDIREDIQASIMVIGNRKLASIRKTNRITAAMSLNRAFLAKADLRDLFLQDFDLTEANCQFADFSRSSCRNTNFFNSRIQRSYFYSTDCENADFRNADLSGAIAFEVNFDFANFSFSNWQGATASTCKFNSANFVSSTCQKVDFSHGEFAGAKFQGADLSESKCDGTDFVGTQFNGANLKSAQFQEADLRDCNMTGALIDAADFRLAKGMTAEMLFTAFGNLETKLPTNLMPPKDSSFWTKVEEESPLDLKLYTRYSEFQNLRDTAVYAAMMESHKRR